MKALLLAAGLGTRLKPLTDSVPKALVKINGISLLEHNIRYLQRHGIYDVIVNVHHFADMIEDAIKVNHGFGSRVSISDERSAVLETGGGVKQAAPFFDSEQEFVVMNVDILTNLNLTKLIEYQQTHVVMATLAVMNRPSSRSLLFDWDMNLCGWRNNNNQELRMARACDITKPFSFSGVQVISNVVWRNIPFEGKFSLIDLYLYLAKTNPIHGYNHTCDMFVDVGKPDAIKQAELLIGK